MKKLGTFNGIRNGNVYLDGCGCCMWSRNLADLNQEELRELEQELTENLRVVRALQKPIEPKTTTEENVCL